VAAERRARADAPASAPCRRNYSSSAPIPRGTRGARPGVADTLAATPAEDIRQAGARRNFARNAKAGPSLGASSADGTQLASHLDSALGILADPSGNEVTARRALLPAGAARGREKSPFFSRTRPAISRHAGWASGGFSVCRTHRRPSGRLSRGGTCGLRSWGCFAMALNGRSGSGMPVCCSGRTTIIRRCWR